MKPLCINTTLVPLCSAHLPIPEIIKLKVLEIEYIKHA